MKKLKLITLAVIYGWILTANVHAADTYDLPNKTLTIPQVVVGDVTYNNVVLKLNDFEVLKFEQPAPNKLTCSNYAAGTDLCADGKYPTCEVSFEQVNQVKTGMTYQQVIQIAGCHGVLAARGNAPVAIYTWGTASFISHSVVFVDGVVQSVS